METFSALLAICAGNSLVRGEFPTQRPVMRSFDVFFDLHLNKWLSKQRWGWWFETPPCPLWRHRNGANCVHMQTVYIYAFRCTVCYWLIDKTGHRYESKTKPEHWRANTPKLQSESKIKVLIKHERYLTCDGVFIRTLFWRNNSVFWIISCS